MAAELPPIINKLRVTVELTANPYRHASAALEAWGRLSITILREGTMPPFAIPLRVELFETQWDLADLAVWIAANHHALRDEHLPTDVGYPAVLPRESLAQALRRLQTREFAENEDEAAARWYDALYRYHQHHGLQFALRGARCPDIIIGCQGQQGEISRAALLEDEAGDHAWAFLGAWAFTFDMDDFLADLEHNLIRVLTEWTLQSQEAGVHARAQSIIEQLAKHVASSGTAR